MAATRPCPRCGEPMAESLAFEICLKCWGELHCQEDDNGS
ncbi:hypothetical protein LCGC14_1378090 [marine sediment metagenome]|uniref:Uncharacterized protein n=1 Tax=marine sediment metagenome TaxID=412755 RepID=A0A0F9K3H3_9ZZZZ